MKMDFKGLLATFFFTFGILLVANAFGVLTMITDFVQTQAGAYGSEYGLGVLSAWVYLSVVVFIAALIGSYMVDANNAGRFQSVLIVSAIIVGLSVLAPTWLPSGLQLLAAAAQSVFGLHTPMSVLLP